MSHQEDSFDRELQSIFERVKSVPERDADAEQRSRAAFLWQAQEIGQGVSPNEKRRHKEWFTIFQKERLAMFATILVVLGLLFGGSGATVYAAQNSMPGEILYPVKAWSETVRSDLTSQPEARYELMLQFANQRTEEIQFLAQNGEGNGDAAQQLSRLQLHLDEALRQTARLQDQDMLRALTQIRDRLHQQDQTLQQAQTRAGPSGQAVLEQTRQTLRDREQLANSGLADPQGFRQQERQQRQNQQQIHLPTATTVAETGEAPAVVEPNASAVGAGNPWTTGTPTPGSGYGEGSGGNPWTTGTPTPGSGYGQGTGSNPWTTGTPTPGSGYGPGPGTGGACTNDCDGSSNPDGNGGSSNGGSGGGSGSGTGGGASKRP